MFVRAPVVVVVVPVLHDGRDGEMNNCIKAEGVELCGEYSLGNEFESGERSICILLSCVKVDNAVGYHKNVSTTELLS